MHARPPSLLLFVQRCSRLPHPCLGLAAACFSLSPAPELGFAGSRETLEQHEWLIEPRTDPESANFSYQVLAEAGLSVWRS